MTISFRRNDRLGGFRAQVNKAPDSNGRVVTLTVNDSALRKRAGFEKFDGLEKGFVRVPVDDTGKTWKDVPLKPVGTARGSDTHQLKIDDPEMVKGIDKFGVAFGMKVNLGNNRNEDVFIQGPDQNYFPE